MTSRGILTKQEGGTYGCKFGAGDSISAAYSRGVNSIGGISECVINRCTKQVRATSTAIRCDARAICILGGGVSPVQGVEEGEEGENVRDVGHGVGQVHKGGWVCGGQQTLISKRRDRGRCDHRGYTTSPPAALCNSSVGEGGSLYKQPGHWRRKADGVVIVEGKQWGITIPGLNPASFVGIGK